MKNLKIIKFILHDKLDVSYIKAEARMDKKHRRHRYQVGDAILMNLAPILTLETLKLKLYH